MPAKKSDDIAAEEPAEEPTPEPSEARRKFLAGEMSWRDYVEADGDIVTEKPKA